MSEDKLSFQSANEKWVQLTIDQLNKDLGRLGTVFLPSRKNFYPLLIQSLSSTLKSQKNTDLQSLIYRIDLSENTIRNLTNSYTGSSYYNALAEHMIQREFKKVYIRTLYSKKST